MSHEVEGSGERDGGPYLLWVGGFGASGDIRALQAETFLVYKDFVVSPMSEVDRFSAMTNMKEWQCCIIQISNKAGEPIESPVVYALFLNNLVCSQYWAITGERNRDGIFHTHCMLRTGSRSDSVRRTMTVTWNNLLGSSEFRKLIGEGTQSATMDCLKIQRCHKPESMFGYMMKNPQWCMSNSEHYLQYMYDIWKWDLNARWKPKDDEGEGEPERDPGMNQMAKEITDIIMLHGCCTFEEVLRCGQETMSKYLHRPGLASIVQNCLTFVKTTGTTWKLALFEIHDPDPSLIHKILLHQGIVPSSFDEAFYNWIQKLDSKRNTICIRGPSNTGKSAFISGFKGICRWGEVVNGQTFMFEGLIDVQFGVWEEPLCSPEAAEKAKQVLEGMETSIPVKYKKPYLLKRCPIIITTNHDLWRYCTAEEQAFRNRMYIFDFSYPVLNTMYTCRASEQSCECPYCRESRGGTPAAGEPSTSGMSPKEQSIPTGEQPSGSGESSDVRTGSMCGAGGGSSRSEESSSTDQQCSDTTEHQVSTSSGVQQHMGQFRIVSARYDERKPRPIAIDVESKQRRGDYGRHSTVIRGGSSGKRRRDVIRHRGMDQGVQSVATETSETEEIQMGPRTKRSRVAKKMGSVNVSLPLQVPTPEDWKKYLSYLYHWYG